MRVSCVDSIGAVQPAEWARVAVRGGLYASHPWLLALEGQAGFDPRYLLATASDGRLLGALPVYRVEGPGTVSLYDHYALFVEPWAGATDASGSWFPALYAGTKAGYQNEVLVDVGLDAPATRRVLAALVERLAALAGAQRVRSQAWLYLTERAAGTIVPLLGERARLLLSGASTHVAIRWRSFDGYLASLSRSRRHQVRREIDRFGAAGHRVDVGRLSECCQEAGPLLANVQRKYGHGSTPEEMTEQLRRQAAVLDEHSVVFQCRRGSSLVGYCLCFAWGEELYARTVGFDYGATGSHAEYFNLNYYLPIRYAIEHGLRTVHLGTQSYEAKLARGAAPRPLWSAVVPGGPQAAWERWQAGWNAAQLRRLREELGSPSDPPWGEGWDRLKTGGVER